MNEITTIEQLEERIKQIEATSALMISANADLIQTTWWVQNIPYKVFEGYRQKLISSGQEVKVTSTSPTLFYHASYAYVTGANIVIWSVPVKCKTTYEVIEEIPEKENVS